MKSSKIRMAWREKLAICIIILFLSCSLLFFLIGFGNLMCPRQMVFTSQEISQMDDIKDPHVFAYGRLYRIPDIISNHIASYVIPEFRFASLLGTDVSSMFFKQDNFEFYCPGLAIPDPDWDTLNRRQRNDATNYAHRQGQFYLEMLNRNAVGRVAWPMQYIEKQSNSENRLIVINDNVYDVSSYFNSQVKFLPALVETLFSDFYGKDATPQWRQFEASESNARQYLECVNHLFYIGTVDKRNSLQCQLSNYILLGFTSVLVTIIVFKFLSALSCGSGKVPEESEKYVIIQIPCYTENYESLSNTLEAIANLDYQSEKYLMFIVVDGIVTGSGNDKPTHLVLFEALGIDDMSKRPQFMYESLGEGEDQLNRGRVYTGLYLKNGKEIPFVVVVKVGREDEIVKPGNRGKRDSQLILMRLLSRCYFDSPMSPLEIEVKTQMIGRLGKDPGMYEYCLMVDSDTIAEPESLKHLVASFTHDSKKVGICGETRIANDKASWITMIQVYEYFISHHLSKSFESLFGSVTCLPGCFSMYRIRSANGKQPLFISPKIIKEYSLKKTNTLHLKNLLLLGEDRYLTTLMMKHFPRMKLSFNPDAKCKTVVPEEWSVLLSQRRRWINSTVHNLYELMGISNLCGCCIFSMKFIVFIDLFSTLVQPAGLLYVGYLIYSFITQTEVFPLISIFMLAGAYGLQVIIFLFKREWAHIGWMIIYLFAMPVFGFYMPLYSFWKMDDFSWGSTRQVQEEESDSDDELSVSLSKWKENDTNSN
jgi:chitin synthase